MYLMCICTFGLEIHLQHVHPKSIYVLRVLEWRQSHCIAHILYLDAGVQIYIAYYVLYHKSVGRL